MKVSDAVVEAGCESLVGAEFWKSCPENAKGAYRRAIRRALEAALPMVVGEAVAWRVVYHRDGTAEPQVFVHSDRATAEFSEGLSAEPLYTLTNLEDAP